MFQVDPFLQLLDDCKLQAIKSDSSKQLKVYGSKEDDCAALKFFSEIEVEEDQIHESLASMIVKSLGDLAEVIYFLKLDIFSLCSVIIFLSNKKNPNFSLQTERSSIREQLLSEFSPDDLCPLGSPNGDIADQIISLSFSDYRMEEEVA